MRDQWYGDNRDLVKWSVLLRIAQERRAARILQVAYLRPSHWPGIAIDGQPHPIPEAVFQHFRDVRRATELTASPQIEVLAAPFDERRAYQQLVFDAIATRPITGPTVVFLDPDTGLAPQNPDFKHVLDEELSEIWGALQLGDVLVFYQHQTNRNGSPWIAPKLAQFEDALGVPHGTARVAYASAIARDVAFFFCAKGAA